MGIASSGVLLGLMVLLASWSVLLARSIPATASVLLTLVVLGLAAGVHSSVTGHRGTGMASPPLLGASLLLGGIQAGLDASSLMAQSSLLLLLGLMQASHGVYTEVAKPLKADEPLRRFVDHAQGRRILAITTAVGASYLLSLILLNAGLLLGLGLASEYTAFALAVAILLVVLLLATLPIGRREGGG
jgi:hypothetical protein